MTFRVAHWDMLHDSLALYYTKGRYFEHTNGKFHVFTFQYTRGRYSGAN